MNQAAPTIPGAVLVAGATGRIGADICRAVASAGAPVMVHYRSRESEARTLVDRLREAGGEADAFGADLARREDADTLIAATGSRFGGVYGVVNCVHPQFAPKPLAESDWETVWAAHFEGGLRAAVNLTLAAMAGAETCGLRRMVHISGGLGTRAAAGCAPYSAAKAALNMLAKTSALEFGAAAVTVNIVAPGEVVGAGGDATDHPATFEELNKAAKAAAPLAGVARPPDVSEAVLYFLGPGAGFVTGQTLYVSGGQVMP